MKKLICLLGLLTGVGFFVPFACAETTTINSPTVFKDDKYGFYMELYPEYKQFSEGSSFFITGKKNEVIQIDVGDCDKAEKARYLTMIENGEYPPVRKAEVIQKGTQDIKDFEVYFWLSEGETFFVWDYLLFPFKRNDFKVYLTFGYPKDKEKLAKEQIKEMIATAKIAQD